MTRGDSIRGLLGRRDLLILGTGAFVVAAVPLAARRERLVRRTVPVMGTVAEIAVVHADVAMAHQAIDAALAELVQVDRTMTRFDASSEIGRANALAGHRPARVSATTASVLREAIAWAEATEGAFDPCLGCASDLWDVAKRTSPPPAADVRRLAGRRLYRALDVESSGGTAVVRIASRDAAIDLGGIAKGHGVDRAVEVLRTRGILRAFVNAGGDLYAMGEAERGEPWTVGIQSPDDPGRIIETVSLRDAAVATSGDYMQFFVHAGRRYHHLLDPVSAEPRQTAVRSVTVQASTCTAADAAATAVYGMAPDAAARVLRHRAPGSRIVRVIGTTTTV
jgi:thiamine biosynthesis lipoprotein